MRTAVERDIEYTDADRYDTYKNNCSRMSDKELIAEGFRLFNLIKNSYEGIARDNYKNLIRIVEAEQDKRGIY